MRKQDEHHLRVGADGKLAAVSHAALPEQSLLARTTEYIYT